jgi:hypothetical protein
MPLAVVITGIIVWAFRPRPHPPPDRPVLRLEPVAAIGPGAGPLADSISAMLIQGLRGFTDFTVTSEPLPNAVLVTPRLVLTGPELRLEAELKTDGTSAPATRLAARGRVGNWAVVADSLLDLISLEVLSGSFRKDPWFPTAALPVTTNGLRALAAGERLYAQARFDEAARAYLEAVRLDTACVLCLYRLNDIDRWLTRPPDTARMSRLRARLDRFPGHYQVLIRAASLPEAERIALLDQGTRERGDFYLGWFMLGEELFHRGPLIGRSRREAIEPFRTAARVRPEFAPAWHHLVWVFVAEGDSAAAAEAMARAEAIGVPPESFEFATYALVRAAYAWRWGGTGAAVTQGFLADPRVGRLGDLPAAPRLFATFDLPQVGVALGREFAARAGDPALRRSGLIAETFGHLALGRIDSATRAAATLARAIPEEPARLLALSVPVAAALATGDSLDQPTVARLEAPLAALLTAPGLAGSTVRGAAVLFGLLETGRGRPLGRSVADPLAGPEATGFRSFLAAAREAERGNLARALVLSDGVERGAPLDEQVFFRGLVRIARADWFARTGQPAAAIATLHWFEHQDLIGLPTGPPVAAEADWAFSTWAKWRLMSLLRGAGGDPERACHNAADVVRSWAGAEPRLAARADSARALAAACRS